MFRCISPDLWQKLSPSRTAITFFMSGSFLALGYWIIFGVGLMPDDSGNPIKFDGYLFLPGAVILMFMFLLNSFTTRHVIFHDESSFFASDTSQAAKFFVYFSLSVSFVAIGGAFALGSIKYIPEGKSSLAFATIAQSISTFLSSMIVFFGRELDSVDY